MCLILFACRPQAELPLVLAANRDEYFARPTRPAHWWREPRGVLAGRDLAGGGTWFGVDRQGRWGAVTNIRTPLPATAGRRSRGLLVRDYLAGRLPARDYLARVAADRDNYPPFNLLVGDSAAVGCLHSLAGEPRPLGPGIYGLSNAELDTPWPKVSGGKARLRELLTAGPPDEEDLFGLLADRTPAAPEDLPDTGIPRPLERQLSPRFIHTPSYGTRSSTLLIIDRAGAIRFRERSFSPEGTIEQEVAETFAARG